MPRATLPVLLLLPVIASLAGCHFVTTPDGHRFSNWSDVESVKAELGEPDLFRSGRVYHFLSFYEKTTMTYIDRNYDIILRDGGVAEVEWLEDRLVPELRCRANALKHEVHKIKPGASVPDVINASGPPSLVEFKDLTAEGEPRTRVSLYTEELELTPPASMRMYWADRCIVVDIAESRVTHINAFESWTRSHRYRPLEKRLLAGE